ncbi:hypothetical protein CLV30_12826 [Haloactinopolyspora alba]|uniref:Uncharacterized protein n=1 Tax=Haloactinopolyspora alba TaxID=648780 RepID=A0A2P8DEX8_9ACTN|nr:hypothetical protein [Haloactinopolyspora alba]PSK95774.1 hypothetical protein CLV30_12826 [Haloactinopolyspora alba]
MLTYATETDLTASPWGIDPVPANVAALLRSASLLVRRKTRTAVYATDADGYPSDTGLRQAFTDATCAQAASWAAAGIDPTGGTAGAKQTAVTSKGIGSASLSYAGGAAAADARARALDTLCPDAATVLVTAGVLHGEPLHNW